MISPSPSTTFDNTPQNEQRRPNCYRISFHNINQLDRVFFNNRQHPNELQTRACRRLFDYAILTDRKNWNPQNTKPLRC